MSWIDAIMVEVFVVRTKPGISRWLEVLLDALVRFGSCFLTRVAVIMTELSY